MDNKNFENMTCEELIRSVYHELNQKCATTAGIVEILLNKDAYGFVNDEQKDLILWLEKELKIIRSTTDSLRKWFLANKNNLD